MHFFILSIVVASVAYADNLESSTSEISTYGYISKFGIPEADRISKLEAEYKSSSRIVGGLPATIGQYRFKAGLIGDVSGLNAVSVCGGSLISTTRVATAAHCWNDGVHQIWRFTVVFGSELLFSGGTRVTTSAVAVHPNWSPILVRNDVAVLYLPSAVAVSDTIAPIALPTGSLLFENFAGESAIAVGYGVTRDDYDITTSQSLHHIRLNVVTNTVCRFAYPIFVQASNICTNGLGGVGICRGDSGGPLIVERDGRQVLIGVSSFTADLGCQVGMPSVFARVTSYMDFFSSNM